MSEKLSDTDVFSSDEHPLAIVPSNVFSQSRIIVLARGLPPATLHFLYLDSLF